MTDYTDYFGRGGLNDQVNLDTLLDRIGLDEDEIEWRKEFMGFGDRDVERLQRYERPFRRSADEVADRFYDRLSAYDETRAVFDRSPKNIDQLKQTQKAYLGTLADGDYGEEYFRNRARIGKLHELLDMPTKLYLGQYTLYYDVILDLVGDRIGDSLDETVESLLDGDGDAIQTDGEAIKRQLREDVEDGLAELHSLMKLLNLDMQVAVDTYISSRIEDVEVERDRFAALFENVPTPVVIVKIADGNLQVEQVNPAFRELFGYTAADLSDQHFEDLLRPPDAEPRPIDERDFIENVRSSTQSELADAQVTLETQFGRREFIRVAAPIDLPSLSDLEYAFYIDITDQKQQKERLQVLSRVLRHDLRNQLTIMHGNLDRIEKRIDDETCQEIIESIRDSGEQVLAKSDRIRAVERLIADPTERHPVDIVTIVTTVLEEMREAHPDCQFTMSGPDSIRVQGTSALHVALKNVIENGVEHNDAAEPSVDVTVVEGLNTEYVQVRIADNGPGIPPAEYEVLIGERDHSQIDHLSGLGLWTVNWIVTGIGGGIQFDPNYPRGSVVTLRLPRVDASDS